METELLKIEYRELCQDWRMRDKYVLDKLGVASILFALLGLAMAAIPDGKDVIRFLLASLGALYSFILCISIFKDIYYRDSTRKLIECLYEFLCIKNSLQNIHCEVVFEEGLRFPRKIKVKDLGETSYSRFPKPIRNILGSIFKDRDTLKWVFGFYFIVFIVFLSYAIYILWVYWRT